MAYAATVVGRTGIGPGHAVRSAKNVLAHLFAEVAALAVVFAIVLASWSLRQRRGRRRLREIDEGRRCVACDHDTLDVAGTQARCQRCGHGVDLAHWRSVRVRDEEIERVTEPDPRDWEH